MAGVDRDWCPSHHLFCSTGLHCTRSVLSVAVSTYLLRLFSEGTLPHLAVDTSVAVRILLRRVDWARLYISLPHPSSERRTKLFPE
jgi:hypothetical protein